MRHWIVLTAACCANLFGAASPTVTLQVSSETAPPGGYAQFKVYVTSPSLISSATVGMTFDPAIFGPYASVAAFSATGDQTGSTNVNSGPTEPNEEITAYFTSLSASIGQLPNLPILVVTVPVLATAKIGATSSITVDPTQFNWLDQNGNNISVSVNPGTFTVGGSLSVQSVAPGGGLLAGGTVVAINGAGFDAATAVAIDGVSIASTQLVSAQQINVTLGGATEMAGKHVHVSNPSASVDYFASLPSGNLILPLLPSLPYPTVGWSYPENGAFFVAYDCLQNSNAFPVTANFYYATSADQVTSQSVVIPPYGLYLGPPANLGVGQPGVLYTTLSAPIRMAQFDMEIAQLSGPPTIGAGPPGQVTNLSLLGISVAPDGFSWTWQLGTPAPQPQRTVIYSGFPFTVSLSGGAQAWLNVTPMSGTTGTLLTLTPIVSNLGLGNYTGTVTLTEQLPPDLAQLGPSAASFTVSLDATTQSALLYPNSVQFLMSVGGAAPAPAAVSITSNGTPAAFTTSITGASWLSVTPTSGTTPATLTLTANPAGLAPGIYNANVAVQGPVNTVYVSAGLEIGPSPLQVSPTSLTFSLPAGQAVPSPLETIFVLSSPLPLTVTTSTQSGGNWLSAAVSNLLMVGVSANAANLGAGTYQGTVTITTSAGNVATVPVTLTATPPSANGPLSVSPSSLTITGPAGTAATGVLNVTGTGYFTIQGTSGTITLQNMVTPPSVTGQFTAPATIQLTALPFRSGTYQESLTLAWNGGSTTIPITDYATASTSAPPAINTIVSSGSATPGSIAPGELITIYGLGLGGAPTSSPHGTQLSINGIAAPLLYASTGQINAVVPYEIGTGVATVQVTAAGIQAGSWAVPIAPSAPSIFTVSSAGVGQGAVVNADGSVNSVTNPAARGSAIQIYATGGGQTSPASSTGATAQSAANLTLPVMVTIGGVNAQVLYAGSAPGEIDGVVQINAVVPQSVTPGIVPIVVTVNGVASQANVTFSVQ